MKSPQLSGSRIITEDASSEMDGPIGIDEPENPVVSGGTSSVSEAALEDVENDEYFQSYEDLEVSALLASESSKLFTLIVLHFPYSLTSHSAY